MGDDDARPTAWQAEFDALRARAVASCVRDGCSAEEAERVVDEVVWELQSEAMQMHYQQRVSREEVDRWYAAQVRALAAA